MRSKKSIKLDRQKESIQKHELYYVRERCNELLKLSKKFNHVEFMNKEERHFGDVKTFGVSTLRKIARMTMKLIDRHNQKVI